MITEYGKWSENSRVHAVGYDGKWLCGRTGMTASECSEDLAWVDCKMCLKKLPDYAVKYIVPSSLIEELKESLRCAKAMEAKAKGKYSSCGIEGLNENAAIYINTWIIPAIEGMLKHFEVK